MIPKSIAEVTPEWLSDALGAKVSAISPHQIGQGVGLMGDIFKVALTYAGDQGDLPDSVVVKLPSSFEDNREQGVALGMFDAEVKFYKELAPEAPTGLPEIYLAEIVAGTSDFVIVMEDLSHLSMVSQADGMSFDQALAAVKVLADIHAVWWNRVQTPELEWIPSMTGPRIEYVDGLLTQIFPVFADGFSDVLPPGGLELYEQFAGNYLSINKTIAARTPWTLAHQDYRVENLMFGKNEVVVLDWQGIGRGPGMYDLAYVLGGSMEIALRRQHEAELVSAYQQQLVAAGVSDYSPAQAKEDYAFAQLMGGLAVSIVTGGTLDLSNERGKQLVATMAERHVTAALDHHGPELLAQVIK